MSKKFIPITQKVITIIILTLIFGIGSIISISYWYISTTTNKINSFNLNMQAEYLYLTIRNIMLPGQASLAEGFFRDISTASRDYTIKLFRQNGQKAFSDNTTIESVNKRWGSEKFSPVLNRVNDGEKPVDPYFQTASSPSPSSEPVSFRIVRDGKVNINIYKMLVNTPKCSICHGEIPTVRGIVSIEKNITGELNDQYMTLAFSIIIFIVVVLSLSAILYRFMRNTIIKPVKVIGDVCTGVTGGNYENKVDINNQDEIGVLGRTVNKMVEGLHERFKLSKYVSVSTIQSLKTEKKGEKIPLTILFSDIRNFTTFSENKQPEDVVTALNKILSFQTDIIHNDRGDIDKYVGDEIVAFYSGKDPELSACVSALKIQRELAVNGASTYGGLQVGIGINQGEVILGMVGSERRADYTIIGDNVNTASRLCSTAKGGQIIISESIYQKINDRVIAEGPYRINVKGKNLVLKVYSLKDLKAV